MPYTQLEWDIFGKSARHEPLVLEADKVYELADLLAELRDRNDDLEYDVEVLEHENRNLRRDVAYLEERLEEEDDDWED